jgi:hypothetical protein
MQQRVALIQPDIHHKTVKPYHQFIRMVRTHLKKPVPYGQPLGMRLPNRVWARRSALIMSMYEAKDHA